MAKKSNAHFLNDVMPENCFWCCDGTIIKNLSELEFALKKMKVKTFNHHVNKDKNDFSSWINDVIGDVKLADDLKKSTDKKSISKKVSDKVKSLKK